VDVDRINAPHAEINTAGVIMAVKTASADESASKLFASFESIYNGSTCVAARRER